MVKRPPFAPTPALIPLVLEITSWNRHFIEDENANFEDVLRSSQARQEH